MSTHTGTARWLRTPPVTAAERLRVQGRIDSLANVVNSLRQRDSEGDSLDAQTWAMRLLEAQVDANAELRELVFDLCLIANDAGLGTRTIAQSLGVSAPTVARYIRTARCDTTKDGSGE